MTPKNENPLAALGDDDVLVLPPDFTLKKIIGEDVDIQQILGSDAIARAQKILQEEKGNFLEWVMRDIAMLEKLYEEAASDLPASEPVIRKLARAAFVIKSQAGTFGFELATGIAKSLDDFCSKDFKPAEAHMTVIRKHIDALALIFHQNITGDGEDVGRELTEKLSRLVQKYTY